MREVPGAGLEPARPVGGTADFKSEGTGDAGAPFASVKPFLVIRVASRQGQAKRVLHGLSTTSLLTMIRDRRAAHPDLGRYPSVGNALLPHGITYS